MLVLSVVFNVMEKNKVVYVWATKYLVQYIAALYQLLTRYRRPCQMEELKGQIKIEEECFDSGYGSPSQQCFILSFIATTLYLNKYYEVGKQAVRFKSVMCTGYIIKMALTAMIGSYFIMLTFAQLYLG